ncbi:MAG TPA: hypothetical protein VJ552_14125 [Sediminibacterium sp.]|nr:hypothetical protein [Sediminibacterium sp.]
MKKSSLLLFTVLLFALKSTAQFETGQRIFSGGINFNNYNNQTNLNNSTSKNAQTSFSLDASLGKFVRPNVARGFSINYGHNYQKSDPSSYKMNYNSVGLGIFSTHYRSFGKNFFGFLRFNLNGSYQFGNTVQSGVDQKNRGYEFSAGLTPGISYQISKRILLNGTLNNIASLNFNHRRTTYSNSGEVNKINQIGLYSSLSNGSLGAIGLGFSLLLNK